MGAYKSIQTVKNIYISNLEKLLKGGTSGRWDGSLDLELIEFPEWVGRYVHKVKCDCTSVDFSSIFVIKLLLAVPVGFSDWERIRRKFVSILMQESLDKIKQLDISDDLKRQTTSTIKECQNCLDCPLVESTTIEAKAWIAIQTAIMMAKMTDTTIADEVTTLNTLVEEWSAVQNTLERHGLILVSLFEEEEDGGQ